jgi:glycosyltransferase involved in cell wall biosynthesis
LGVEVDRFSIRDTRGTVIDPRDRDESHRTFVLLRPAACLAATVRVACTRPGRFLRALRVDLALWRNAGSGLVRHLAYLAEACHLLLRVPSAQHVHAHFGTNSASVAMLCHLLGGPTYIFRVHGPEVFDRPERESLATKVSHSKFVAAVCNFGRAQLQRWCPAEDWDKIKVVRCGLGDELLAKPTIPISDTCRLVCVGRLSPQKGLLTLVDAAQQLASSGVQFELIVVGDGPLRPELEERIAAAGLGDRVRLVGSQTGDEVLDWLDSARAFVLPSSAEGLPVVIMEAFARARPVISTYVAGIPELVSEENGWLVPAGSVASLVTAMRQALELPAAELYDKGKRGRACVEKHHSARVQASELAELFAGGK